MEQETIKILNQAESAVKGTTLITIYVPNTTAI